MIKFCISSPKLFSSLVNKRIFRDFFCYNLYGIDDINDPELFSHAIFNLRMGNGTYKSTDVDRLADVDSFLIQFLSKEKRYAIHDMAVSDGVTSVELHERMVGAGFSAELSLSDKYVRILFSGNKVVKHYFDSDGVYLYSDVLGIQASRILSWKKYFISRLLGTILYSFRSRLPTPKGSVLLLNPITKSYVEGGNARFFEYDIFDQPSDTYDVARAMNIVNPRYFVPTQIEVIIRNIYCALNKEGFLLVGRTDPDTRMNDVSLFQKTTTGFRLIGKLNGGSEVQDNILKFGS